MVLVVCVLMSCTHGISRAMHSARLAIVPGEHIRTSRASAAAAYLCMEKLDIKALRQRVFSSLTEEEREEAGRILREYLAVCARIYEHSKFKTLRDRADHDGNSTIGGDSGMILCSPLAYEIVLRLHPRLDCQARHPQCLAARAARRHRRLRRAQRHQDHPVV